MCILMCTITIFKKLKFSSCLLKCHDSNVEDSVSGLAERQTHMELPRGSLKPTLRFCPPLLDQPSLPDQPFVEKKYFKIELIM